MQSYLVSGAKDACSGCGACVAICPQKCIKMTTGKDGFRYPEMNQILCTSCGLCERVCPYSKLPSKAKPLQTFAALNRDVDKAQNASSAGVFSALAEYVIGCDGVVFGAAFDDKYQCHHQKAETKEEVYPLRKSKYVQSDTADTFSQVKRCLKDGRVVLYSGTPCQIAGLLAYIGKENDNLITIDVACHGVPSQKDFDACLQYLDDKYGNITDFTFRDKTASGWKHALSFRATKAGVTRKYTMLPYQVPYYYYFLYGRNLRESCYSCRYADQNRISDITLADFWGAEACVSGDLQHGVSAVLCNTQKGAHLFEQVASGFSVQSVDLESVTRGNQPLNGPVGRYAKRDSLLREIMRNGYSEKACGYISLKEKTLAVAKACVPDAVKRKIRKMIGGR